MEQGKSTEHPDRGGDHPEAKTRLAPDALVAPIPGRPPSHSSTMHWENHPGMRGGRAPGPPLSARERERFIRVLEKFA